MTGKSPLLGDFRKITWQIGKGQKQTAFLDKNTTTADGNRTSEFSQKIHEDASSIQRSKM